MTAITYTGATPTVGADEDTWGTELNTSLGQIATDLSMLNTATANSILGRNEATSGEVERLTGTEVTAMLNAVVGDSGAGGTKGLVPAPAAGDAAAEKYLNADGTWGVPKPHAFALINGATGALVAGHNVTSTSRAALGNYTVTMTNAAASANYNVQATARLASGSGFAIACVDEGTPPTTTVVAIRTALLTATPSIASGDVAYLYVVIWQ